MDKNEQLKETAPQQECDALRIEKLERYVARLKDHRRAYRQKWRLAQAQIDAQQAQQTVAWMLEFSEEERQVTTDPNEVEMWRTQHDNPYNVIELCARSSNVQQERAEARHGLDTLTPEQFDGLIMAALEKTNCPRLWSALTHESGPYSVDRPDNETTDFVRNILACALAISGKRTNG